MAQFSYLEKWGLFFIVFLVLYFVKFLFNIVYTYAIGPTLNKVDFKSKGKWALVTGCTDGIGQAYARELASKGCDIVLVSRSMDKLKATAQKIEKDFNVSTKIIQADFSEGDQIYEKIGKEIADLEIGTLVNNVGISYPYPEYFLEVPDWENAMKSLLNVNIVSVTKMTGLVLPGMEKRGRGVIINVGSASAIVPSPLLTVYAATKAYVDKFSEGLAQEYGKKGVIVQCVHPGFVSTKMSRVRASVLAPSAAAYVRSALALAGTAARTAGYLPHAAFVALSNAINDLTGPWLALRSMENLRAKAHKKFKKQKGADFDA